MNEGARQANHDSDVAARLYKQDKQIALLEEIRDLLRHEGETVMQHVAHRHSDEVHQLRAEIERLSAALHEAHLALARARPYVKTCADPNGKDNASAALRGIDAVLE